MSELRDDDLERELTSLSRALDQFRAGAPPRALIDATLARAKRELREQIAARRLPVGFRRELAKIAIAATPPLAMVLAWNAFFLPRLAGYLDRLLPTPLANGRKPAANVSHTSAPAAYAKAMPFASGVGSRRSR
jgi:hypothetical protein